MRNPLRKRLPRELKAEWKKYLILFVLLTVTIGFVSGTFVANNSMETAANEAFEVYTIEDGHLELKDPATDSLLAAFAAEGVRIFPQFYKTCEEDLDGDGTSDASVRVFVNREEVNRACLMDGAFATADNEIVIDRMHADNRNIRVGDVITVDGTDLTVSGLVAFSDYSTLFENNTDVMFNALTFNVASVTAGRYAALQGQERYQYAYLFDTRPADDSRAKQLSDDLIERLAVLAATGGMLDDADEADRLKDDVEEWKAYLEGIADRADRLQEQGDALNARKEELERQAADLQARGEELQARGASLQQRGAALQARAAALSPAEQLAAAAELQAEQAAIERESAALQQESAALQTASDTLRQQGDALQTEADALQADADALEAERERIDEVKGKLEALEPYEDHVNEVTDYVPSYANQAIHFAPNDFGSDKSMAEVLLIILVGVLAFIFAITAGNTIISEAAVIGTLRASGYTKWELLRHYVAMPVLITLLAALVGNLLGYTVFKNAVAGMYYNSYSLPTYVTRWNGNAFIRTTAFPVLLMVAVNLAVVARKLRFSPLQFLRRDLSASKRKKAVRLPRWKFPRRFRLRILLQNVTGYLTLILGIYFVMVLLAFSVGMPATLKHYQSQADRFVITDYEVLLKDYKDDDGNLLTTAEPTAEIFCAARLQTVDGVHPGEEITVYGYVPGSRYLSVEADPPEDGVLVSTAYADKYSLREGQQVVLQEKYAADTYTFTVAGVYDLPGTLAILMPDARFNTVFDREADSFSGYLSQQAITDIPQDKVASVITVDDTLKMVHQLDHSLGGFMDYFSVVCMLVAMLILFLLTKLIIERNAGSISMCKVLGYTNREINRLYVGLTTAVVVIASVGTAFLAERTVAVLWRVIMYRMTGWFTFWSGWQQTLQIILMVVAAYLVVAFWDMRRVRRIPMTDALKNVE